MAIAYFIPDQSKLLAGSTGNGSSNTSNNNHSNNSVGGQNSNQSTTTNPTAPNMHSHQYQHHNHNNNNFRANITIPLTAHYGSAVQHNVGCWDLITQVFCYALRFYHESNTTSLNPGFIQISLEISGGSVGTPTAATTPPATQQQQPTAAQSGRPTEGPNKN